MNVDVIEIGIERGRWVTTRLGEWMSARRRALGMTQEELAHRAGVSSNTVQTIEQGKVRWPRREVRLKLCRVLAVSHLEFMVGAGEIDPAELGVPPTPPDQVGLQALAQELPPEEIESVKDFIRFRVSVVRDKRSRAD